MSRYIHHSRDAHDAPDAPDAPEASDVRTGVLTG